MAVRDRPQRVMRQFAPDVTPTGEVGEVADCLLDMTSSATERPVRSSTIRSPG